MPDPGRGKEGGNKRIEAFIKTMADYWLKKLGPEINKAKRDALLYGEGVVKIKFKPSGAIGLKAVKTRPRRGGRGA